MRIWGVRTIFLAELKVESHRCSATITSVTSSRKTCLCTNAEISVPVCFPYLKWLQTAAGGGWLSLTMTVPILLMKTAVKPTFSSVRLKVTGKVTRIHKLAHLTHHHLTKRCRFPLVSMRSRARFTYAQKKAGVRTHLLADHSEVQRSEREFTDVSQNFRWKINPAHMPDWLHWKKCSAFNPGANGILQALNKWLKSSIIVGCHR